LFGIVIICLDDWGEDWDTLLIIGAEPPEGLPFLAIMEVF
jgi:hypothetical protein